MKQIVLYHANCSDGLGAAAAFAYLNGSSDTTYTAISYGELPPQGIFLDTDIYILDFSFPPETLIEMSGRFKSVTLIDHHKTAIEALAGLPPIENLDLYLSNGSSGAVLTWQHFSRNPAPRFLQYIEDRDLWKFQLRYSKEISAWISTLPRNVEAFAAEIEGFQESVAMTAGRAILDYQAMLMASIIPQELNWLGYDTIVANAPGMLASDLGNALANKTGTFSVTYYIDNKGQYKYSLRSIGDFDVSLIAKKFGGGGHKNAAGFSSSHFMPVPAPSADPLRGTGRTSQAILTAPRHAIYVLDEGASIAGWKKFADAQGRSDIHFSTSQYLEQTLFAVHQIRTKYPPVVVDHAASLPPSLLINPSIPIIKG